MAIRFSLIYPTRHRPAFIRQALRFLEKQKYPNFEVIISDNYVDPALSCENECRSSSLTNIKYVRPPRPVGMVENWNHALQFATGDYICYFTDKMFLLPDTLSLAGQCIERSSPDILNWHDNFYRPKTFPDYFGEGRYVESAPSSAKSPGFSTYEPLSELSKKGRAPVPRTEQDKATYIRGKICFGAYRSELCQRIISRTGALFHNVAPDYTSMILGLSMARSAAELNQAGIVHVNTDLSNGGQVSGQDDFALKFLNELGNTEEILSGFLVPGLYSSMHNILTHDYLTLKEKYKLDFQFDPINWLLYITEDLDISSRQWSSKEVEAQQRKTLQNFINSLPAGDREAYWRRRRLRDEEKKSVAARVLAEKAKARRKPFLAKKIQLYRQRTIRLTKQIVGMVLPDVIVRRLKNRFLSSTRSMRRNVQESPAYCSNIDEVLHRHLS